MKDVKFAVLAAALVALFCSCQSTRMYVKSQDAFYEDDALVAEETKLTRVDYKDENTKQKETLVESVSKRYYDFSDQYTVVSNDADYTVVHLLTAESEKSSKSEYQIISFSLVEASISKRNNATELNVIGKREMRLKDGQQIAVPEIIEGSSEAAEQNSGSKKESWSTSGSSSAKAWTGDAFSDDDEKMFAAVLRTLADSMEKKYGDEEIEEAASAKKLRTESATEKVTVTSTPNGRYIGYAIFGKPFVILGTTIWNVLKCAGYSLINFGGGYGAATGGDVKWKLPSYKKAKEKSVEAKAAAAIQHYPEYHMPFTDNHITVDKYDRNVDVEALVSEGSEKITAIDHQEFDNSINVSLSAKADAASTAATADVIGTAVTIPVSVLTWVGGFAAGVWGSSKK